jgi:hypothetical protein
MPAALWKNSRRLGQRCRVVAHVEQARLGLLLLRLGAAA